MANWLHVTRRPQMSLARFTFPLAAVLSTLLLVAGCGRQPKSSVRVSFESALADLTNVASFAVAPRGTMKMVSTYDRTGGNDDWAKTSSLTSRGTVVLAEMEGPACLRRMWFTGIPDEQELSFYFDGESSPRMKLAVRNFYGSNAPFLVPVAQKLSGGFYSYVPMPFNKSLRVELTVPSTWKNPLPFFQANYEVFGADVDVTTFHPDQVPGASAALNAVVAAWTSISDSADSMAPATDAVVEVAPGAEVILLDAKGPAIIRQFCIRIDPVETMSAVRRLQMTRDLVLRITWDDTAVPSVEIPVGDFFCNALYSRRFSSLAMASQDGTWVCRLPMPFAHRSRVTVRNDGDAKAKVSSSFNVNSVTPQELVGKRYFHASWSQAVGTGKRYSVFGAEGPGHFVGCYLVAIGMDGSWNILEGDETFYLDGAVEPAFHGTGLEDYFNGGWYYYGLFSRPLHGLVDKAPIRTGQYRFHLVDPIRFDKRIALQWEFGHGDAAKGYMSAVAYWYADKPSGLEQRLSAAGRRMPPADPLDRYAVIGGLIELERLGRYDEALEFCRLYAERYQGLPEVEMIRLRMLGYRAIREGFASVKSEYESFASRTNEPGLAEQAKSILAAAAGGSAVVGASGNGPFVVYFDGDKCVSGDHPLRLYSAAIKLSPGDHEFTAEAVAPNRSGPYWILLGMQSAITNIGTDATWEITETRPSNWPRTSDSTGWRPAREMGLPPFMSYWAFEPNGLVNMQSGQRYIDNGGDWPAGRKVYFRKRFPCHAASGSSGATVGLPK